VQLGKLATAAGMRPAWHPLRSSHEPRSGIINSAWHAALQPGVAAVTGSLQLPALAIGPCVDLDSAEVGAVHSVFVRAVNFQVGGSMWALLTADQADAAVETRAFDALGLRGGDRVEIDSGRVVIAFGDARLVVDCRRVPRWQPAPPDALAPGLVDRLRLVAAAHR